MHLNSGLSQLYILSVALPFVISLDYEKLNV